MGVGIIPESDSINEDIVCSVVSVGLRSCVSASLLSVFVVFVHEVAQSA